MSTDPSSPLLNPNSRHHRPLSPERRAHGRDEGAQSCCKPRDTCSVGDLVTLLAQAKEQSGDTEKGHIRTGVNPACSCRRLTWAISQEQ